MKKEFLPIILGSDDNAYGIARSFHMEYNVKSVALCSNKLKATMFTRIINFKVIKEIHDKDKFVSILIKEAEEYLKEYEKLILIPCSDYYTELVVNNQEVLSKYFVNRFVDKKYLNDFVTKDKFYNMCDKYKINYPKTIVCKLSDRKEIHTKIKFKYPIVLKPNNSNSHDYLEAKIENKKKAYIIKDEAELKKVIKEIDASSYKDNLIIQEFISGGDHYMRVINCYSDNLGKVKMMCLGRPILEEYHPNTIGNYAAIISEPKYNEVLDQIKHFLESINYKGFSNFDMKFDKNDNKYKVFEINPRQGRSSFFVTACGINLAKLLVDNTIKNVKSNEMITCKKEILWLNIPESVLKDHIFDKEILNKVDTLIKEKKVLHTLIYNKDRNPLRIAVTKKLYSIEKKLFKMYFVKKED